MIKTGGEWVSSKELENHIYQLKDKVFSFFKFSFLFCLFNFLLKRFLSVVLLQFILINGKKDHWQ